MFGVKSWLAFVPAMLVALLLVGCTAAAAVQPAGPQPSITATSVPASKLAVVSFYVPTVT